MIAVEDIAYVRIGAPDLDVMETFLTDFGMRRAARTADALYLYGYGPNSVVEVVEKGPARHIGIAFKTQSQEDLERLARAQGTTVEARNEPGGGSVVKLKDPDGNLIEVIHGWTPAATEEYPRPATNLNRALQATRFNDVVRLSNTPSHVMRLGHVAMHASNFAAMRAFYRDVLGMRLSDNYYAGQPENTIAEFLHCGLGDRFVDHHTIALIGNGRTGFDHLGFEVFDLDDLMMGNRYLRTHNRWEHSWGVGRHIDGSQIFDYWRDPTGLKVEHWTDGDLVNDAYKPSNHAFSPETADNVLAQWAPPFNVDFMR